MIIRKTFPQVYALESPKRGKYWLVSARSKKWGLKERKTFPTEELALKYARDLESHIVENGKQPDVPKDKMQFASSYEKLLAKLSSYGRTPEEAVNGLDRQLFCGGGSQGARDVQIYPAFMRYGFRSSLKANYCVHNLGFRCAKDL